MTDDFHIFAAAVEARFKDMSKGELFITDAKDGLFDTYLAAFPTGTNPVYKERTEHDCQCCKNFIRNLGKLVAIKDGNRITPWFTPGLPYPYNLVAEAMHKAVSDAKITGVYRTQEQKYGLLSNFGDDGTKFFHFHGTVEAKHKSTQPDKVAGELNTTASVMRRGLNDLSISAIDQVLDLIQGNALYRGAEHLPAIQGFQSLKTKFDDALNKDLFIWENLGDRAARFKNTVIGTLIVDLSSGVELEDAVKMFEAKVAPQNYKRPTALITGRMIDDAVAKLNELGLSDAINRRYATLADVSVNNVLFVDNDAKGKMKEGIAGLLADSVKPAVVDVKKAQPISAEDFFKDILPKTQTMSVLVQNRHQSNFVSITTGDDPSRIFKWDNPFAWSYDGEVTDGIKSRVKAAGGNVDARMRVSLAWFNFDDLDLHCITPKGTHIYYSNKLGILDVDMNAGGSVSREPVENMAFKTLIDGVYKFSVDQFSKRENIDVGFTIQFADGENVQEFSYTAAAVGRVPVLEVTIENGQVKVLNVSNKLTGGNRSIRKWGIDTETLVPVDTLMSSPNYWDGQAVGNKHWFFLLKDCKNPDETRGIYNEFLRSDLEPHRKVFEVLGAKTKCPPSDEQLSGVGFSSTRGDTVTVVANGRPYNLQF